MSNELQVFKYTEAHQIRTTVIDGEPWFVAKDLGEVLGFSNIRVEVSRLDDDERGGSRIVTPSNSGYSDISVISEPGLYKLIMRSNKPEAKQFTRWVTHDVLPSIHRSGMYLTDKAAEAYLNNPEEFASMAARCSALERKVEAMEKKLEERYTLSVLGETVLAQTGAISFKDGASFLAQHGVPMGQNRLYEYCRKNKLLCSRKGKQWNKPTQSALERGLFNLELNGGFRAITLITPAGLKYLTDKLIAEEYPLLALIDVQAANG